MENILCWEVGLSIHVTLWGSHLGVVVLEMALVLWRPAGHPVCFAGT